MHGKKEARDQGERIEAAVIDIRLKSQRKMPGNTGEPRESNKVDALKRHRRVDVKLST